MRNIRRDAIEKFKAQKKKSEITEDDLKIIEKDLQKLTDDYIQRKSSASPTKKRRSSWRSEFPFVPANVKRGGFSSPV